MTSIINFDVTEAVLNQLREKQALILTENPNIEDVKSGKREIAKLRNAIENRRKELKAEALEYGKKVDSSAKEAQAPVAEIEGRYDVVIEKYEAEKARIEAELREKETTRIADIKDKIDYYVGIGIGDGFSSNELKTELEHVRDFLTEGFDFQEFTEEAAAAFKKKEDFLIARLEARLKYESEQEELKKQQAIQAEEKAKFEAEKAAFETARREANAKIESERAALQKQKDDSEKAEKARLFAEQEKQRLAEEQKRALERRIADEQAQEEKMRRESAERLRIEEIKKENEARKLAQEKEDRVRNAAKDMLMALYNVRDSDMATREEDEGRVSSVLNEVRQAIKLAEGN